MDFGPEDEVEQELIESWQSVRDGGGKQERQEANYLLYSIWRLQDTFEDTEIARKTVIEMIVHAAHASQSGSAASEDDLIWLLCRGICLSVYAT